MMFVDTRRCLLALGLAGLLACSSGAPTDETGSGGATTTGGVSGTGGGSATGGGGGTGGTTTSGSTGGAFATGGLTGTGGASATGGVTGTGGASATGGVSGTGGSATGGRSGTGGGSATGGVSATGGATTSTGGGSGGAAAAGTGGSRAGTGGIVGTGGTMGGSAGNGGTTGSGGAGGGSASAPAVRIVGRTVPGGTGDSTEYAWPGVNMHARFTGTSVSMTVSNATGNNRVTVVVDGGTAKVIALGSGQSTVSLASGLASGTHDLLIWRNTEASPGGTTTFTGLTSFGTGGGLLAPDAAPARRIEVVGDSLSVGAGVEGDSTCSGGIDAYTDNYLAYGSIAARAVSADVVTVAYSGIGVYRNYGETTPTSASLTMPKRYPYAIPDTVSWDFSLYQPQAVIINLGTNDFGSGDPGAPFEAAYVSFVEAIREKYADAYFILIDMYGGTRLTRLNSILASLKAAGETKAEVLSLNAVQNNLGCNQHPDVAGQQAMGTTLAARLRTLFSW